jgi:inhibitor of KinA sporulation pathway (predicted exonuclease)
MINSKVMKIWCSLDLEMNHHVGTENIDDIIQIGAVAFDFYSGEIVDKINLYIKLPDHKAVSPFIEKLTGITDKKLQTEGRDSLWIAYLELVDFIQRNKCFTDAVCWGGNDALYLKNQLIEKCGFNEEKFGRFIFNRNYFDAKKFFQEYCLVNGMNMRSGMAKSMSRLGLKFNGRIHSAIDDAINGATIFNFLCKKFKSLGD